MAINTMPTYFGFNPPFIGGPSGILSRQEDEKLIKNDLLQLLLTIPGERVMMPNFGTQLRATIFDQLDNTTIDMLSFNVTNAINQYETRITLQNVYIQPDYDRHGIALRIVYSIKALPGSSFNLDTFIANGDTNG